MLWEQGHTELEAAGSQGYHLKGGQRTTGRSHILFLSEQPQQDVFLILGPAVNMSVLEPGGHVLLWKRGQEQRSQERSLDSRSRAQFWTVWFALHRRSHQAVLGAAVLLLEGLTHRALLASGASCVSHYGNHMCTVFSVSLPGYLPFTCQRAFHHLHMKGVGQRSYRMMWIPSWLWGKDARVAGLI